MNKVKCRNHHYFDRDRFELCPICGATIEMSAVASNDDKKVDIQNDILETEPLLTEERDIVDSKDVAGSAKEIFPVAMPRETDENESPIEKNFAPPAECKKNESRAADDLEKPVSPLQSAVKNTASTLPSPLPKTVAYYDFDDAIPPVGWLVCVKGTYIGHAFECRTGRNRIGRNPDLDISLTEDKSISREPHAILIYEPKERKFFIQAGSSDGLVYHNGSLLFGHQELSLYDRISLGKAEFIFLPLCGNQFTWDDYMPEG